MSAIDLLSYTLFLISIWLGNIGHQLQVLRTGGRGDWREAEEAIQTIKSLNVMESTMAAHSLLHGGSLVQVGQHGPSA
jgi:hypothetical protein